MARFRGFAAHSSRKEKRKPLASTQGNQNTAGRMLAKSPKRLLSVDFVRVDFIQFIVGFDLPELIYAEKM